MTWQEWQYNGVAPMREILDWCHQHLDGTHWQYKGWETLIFHDESSYTFFKLRWL